MGSEPLPTLSTNYIYWEINTLRGVLFYLPENTTGAAGSGSPHKDPRPLSEARLDLRGGKKSLGEHWCLLTSKANNKEEQ